MIANCLDIYGNGRTGVCVFPEQTMDAVFESGENPLTASCCRSGLAEDLSSPHLQWFTTSRGNRHCP